ncbi:MAG: GAF domain-containing protein [Lysobacterales bacterium]
MRERSRDAGNEVRRREPLPGTADASTRQRRLEQLQRAFEEATALEDLSERLQRLLAQLCPLLGASAAWLALKEREHYRVAAVSGRAPLAPGAYWTEGLDLALAHRQALPAGSADAPQLLLALRWGERVLGAVGLQLPSAARSGAQESELLQQWGTLTALLLVQSEQTARERHRSARFELIAEVARLIGADIDILALLQRAADAIHATLGFQAVDIPTLEPDDPTVLTIRIRGGSYKRAIRQVDRIPIDRGIMGAAVRERRVQLVNDVAADPRYIKPPHVQAPRAELAVPIVLGDHVLGVLNVESDHPFGPLDVASLELIAEFLAVAMRDARLFAQAQDALVLRERQRIARVLHERVSQGLTQIARVADTLEEAWHSDADKGRLRSQRVRALAEGALADMRELLRELAPVQRLSAPASLPGRTSAADALSHEPFAAVVGRQLLALLPPTTHLQLALSEWPPQRVELELMCLQVIQDLAGAACARGPLGLLIVGALSDARHLSLTVADDATPCPQGDATLAALRERVEQAGGHLSHSARASGGTRVVVSFARMDRGPGKP